MSQCALTPIFQTLTIVLLGYNDPIKMQRIIPIVDKLRIVLAYIDAMDHYI